MTAFYILAALAVGSCAGFVLGGVVSAGRIADEQAVTEFVRGIANDTYVQLQEARKALAKFDRDGDGQPGGSLRKYRKPNAGVTLAGTGDNPPVAGPFDHAADKAKS